MGRPPRKGTHMNSDPLGPMASQEKPVGDSVEAKKRKQLPQARYLAFFYKPSFHLKNISY